MFWLLYHSSNDSFTYIIQVSELDSLNFNLLNHLALACAYKLFLARLKQTQPKSAPYKTPTTSRSFCSFLGCEKILGEIRQELATIFRTVTLSLTMKPPMRPHVT